MGVSNGQDLRAIMRQQALRAASRQPGPVLPGGLGAGAQQGSVPGQRPKFEGMAQGDPNAMDHFTGSAGMGGLGMAASQAAAGSMGPGGMGGFAGGGMGQAAPGVLPKPLLDDPSMLPSDPMTPQPGSTYLQPPGRPGARRYGR